jgi:Ala-tRNA(Pro) deacylase
MSLLRSCLSYLESVGVAYTHTVEPASETCEEIATDMSARPIAKAVVCEGDDRYLLVVVPAAWRVDIDQVSHAVGARKVRLATESEIAVLFPFSEVGAVPPLGALVGLPVYLDHQLANQEFITFTAGSYHDLIHVKTAHFLQIEQATIGSFSRYDYQEEFRRRFLASRKAAGA